MDGGNFVGLSDMLDRDITSYEYFYSLSRELQEEIKERDFSSFEEMTEYVSQRKQKK